MQPFVALALKVSEDMELVDKTGRGIVMRFCKIYPPEKIAKVVETAKGFYWWQKNPKAAFMKAVGVVNKMEKKDESGVDKNTPEDA